MQIEITQHKDYTGRFEAVVTPIGIILVDWKELDAKRLME